MNGGAGPGRLDLMDAALAGLSVGDAFGDQFFLAANRGLSPDDEPPGPWEWSDDTELACSVADVLRRLGRIDQDELAAMFAARFDPSRRYGAGALELLEQVRAGVPWRQASAAQFGGRGSHGNGGAMRVAPLGAYYFGNPARAAAEATAQAEVTHANIEGSLARSRWPSRPRHRRPAEPCSTQSWTSPPAPTCAKACAGRGR
jgi:ADP-ribosylglycohydrolase